MFHTAILPFVARTLSTNRPDILHTREASNPAQLGDVSDNACVRILMAAMSIDILRWQIGCCVQ